MRMRSILSLTCALLMASCTASETVTAGNPDPVGVFVESPCPISIPEGLTEGESIRCGTVTVPEFHSEPDSRRLHLPVAVFPAHGEGSSSEPLFVATAGPGTSAIESVTPDIAGPLGEALLASRDLVLIDYRGLPLAEPDLMCPEIIDTLFQALDQAQTGEDYMTMQLESAARCRDRLRGEGVALEAFDNSQTAADVVMVMTALGYDRFHVYGTSAGTLLAQHLLRDDPQRLASVIIDSTVPIGRGNVHTEAPTIAAQTLDTVIRLCEQDEPCGAAFPELRQEAASLVERYDREPTTLTISHPISGKPLDIMLTGHRVAQSLLMLNSQTGTVPLMPLVIHRLATGDIDNLAEVAWSFLPPAGNFSWGLGTSIFCKEYSDFQKEDIAFPGLFPAYEKAVATQSFGAETILRTCRIWGVEPMDSGSRKAATANVPVLLVAGTLDSLTPPRWAHEVAATLPASQVVEVAGYAHSPTFGGPCTAMLALRFLDDPTQPPDNSCLADLELRFVIPQ